jgi:hypothetical protein
MASSRVLRFASKTAYAKPRGVSDRGAARFGDGVNRYILLPSLGTTGRL